MPNTDYEFEVLAIADNGNQTIVTGFFKTNGGGWGAELRDDAPGLIIAGAIVLVTAGLAVKFQLFKKIQQCIKAGTSKNNKSIV